MQTFFVPFPENDMVTSLQVIDAYQGNIGTVVRSIVSMVAGNDGTAIYYDHWEDGYEADATSPTQATTQVWGDGNPANGIPPGYTNDVVNAGSIINLETSMDVTRTAVQIEYDGRDKVSVTKPITMARAQYPLAPGEYIAEAGVALDISQHGTEYIAPFGVTNSLGLYTNQVFEYTAIYIMGDYDYTRVEVDVDNDGIFETTKILNQGEVLFVNGGVKIGARAKANKPFQCHFFTGDISANYETRWYTGLPLSSWSSDYYCPVGTRNGYNGITYKSLAVFYNASNTPITIYYETASSTGSLVVAANSQSVAFVMPVNSGGRFYTTNGYAFSASEIFDGTAPGSSGQLQDYDWGFTMVPRSALSTLGIVGWGPGQGISGGGTLNGSPVWVTPESNTTIYVDLDGDLHSGPFTNAQELSYNFTTNVLRHQSVTLVDDSDTNQTGLTFYTLDGVRLGAAWGEDPARADAGLPYLDAGYEILPFPTIMANKFATLFNDVNGNGYPDPGDTLEFFVDVINVGFATANHVIFRDDPPTNITYYGSNTAYVGGVPVYDDLPPKTTRFPFDEGGYDIGTIGIGATTSVRYLSYISTSLPSNFTGYIHNNATIGGSNGNWATIGFTNVVLGGLSILKTASTTNLLAPGTNYAYTITIANTGSVTYTGLNLEDPLPIGITYLSNSTAITYPGVLTNTFYDAFNVQNYSNQNGSLNWRTDWQEIGEGDGANAGNIRIRMDTGLSPGEAYALSVFGSNSGVSRVANLAGHSSAALSFKYRRDSLDDVNDYVDALISTNNWLTTNTLLRLQGSATDEDYLYTNLSISAYISSNTAIRFRSSTSANMLTTDGVWIDQVKISAIGSNVTFAGNAPPILFDNLSLTPGASMSVTFWVTVDNPPTEQILPNVARVRALEHEGWVYPAPVTNYVNATKGITLTKTANPSGLVGAGTNIQYTITIANTGDVSQTGIQLQDLLPAGVTYISNSATLWRPFAHTNTALDTFNFQTYTNSDGSVDWRSGWTEIGDDNTATGGTIQVAVDSGAIPGHTYALQTAGTAGVQRAVNLSGYTNAALQLDYRRSGLDGPADYMAVLASSNNGISFQDLGHIGGATNDGQYLTVTFNLSAHISTNTIIRLVGSANRDSGDLVWADDVRVLFSSRNATNQLRNPPDLLAGYSMPPRTNMTVRLNATVNNPLVSTQFVNTARLLSDQQTTWVTSRVTNAASGTVGMSIAKTSSITNTAWGLYQTNTYTITLANTGTISQTGVNLNDLLPSNVAYVAGSARIYDTNWNVVITTSTNITTNSISQNVSDTFASVAYTNNDGTMNWSGSWVETGDNNNPNTGSEGVTNYQGATVLIFRDSAADNDYVTRSMILPAAPGLTYTNVTLSFSYRRIAWDTTDRMTFYLSTNGFGGQSNLVYTVPGSGVNDQTDAGYTSISTNVTPWIGTNLTLRVRASGTFGGGDGFLMDDLTIAYSGHQYVTSTTTNITTNTILLASTPPNLLTNYTLVPGTSVIVRIDAVLIPPLTSTQFINTATITSAQQPPRTATATNYAVIGAIGDFVWSDSNQNGIQNVGEPGLVNAAVKLYDSQTNLLATTLTDSTGHYLFSGWPTGIYIVGFTAPANYFFSPRDQGGDDTIDSDANTNSGLTAAFTLASGANTSVDAGLYIPPVSVGNLIWLDSNTNGVQNIGEPGVTGVVVRLYNSSSSLIAITTNDASGLYSFTNLLPGSYFLEFIISSNYVFTLPDQGGDDTLDSDADPLTRRTPIFNLAGGTNDSRWDAGLTLPVRGLQILKTSDATNALVAGDTITYTITVVNTGTVTMAGIALEDTLPPGLTYVADSVQYVNLTTVTNTFRDEFNAIAYTNQDGTMNWAADWQENDPYGTPGPVGDYVGVSGGRMVFHYIYVGDERVWRWADLSAAANATSVRLTFNWEAVSLEATKYLGIEIATNPAGPFVLLGQFTGTASGTTNYDISDYISDSTTVRMEAAPGSANWDGTDYAYIDNVEISYVQTEEPGNPALAPPLLYANQVLAAGASLSVAFQATVDSPSSVTQLLNTAYAYGSSQPVIQSSVTNGVAYADVGIQKMVSDGNPTTVAVIEYILVATNRGPYTATGVKITDVLPEQLQYNSHSNGTYNSVNGEWNIGTLPLNVSTTLYINVTVREAASGLGITNTTTITDRELYDPAPSNDTSKASIQVESILAVIGDVRAFTREGQTFVSWETVETWGALGFYLERQINGEWVRINSDLLPVDPFNPPPQLYEQADPGAAAGGTYLWRLVELDINNNEIIYGPYALTVDGAGRTYDDWSAGVNWGETSAARDDDADGDRLTNWQEFLAGTDPLNADSVLRLTGLCAVSSGIELSWQSVPGRQYRIAVANQVQGPYLPLDNVIHATGNSMTATLELPPGDGPGFFRVIMVGGE